MQLIPFRLCIFSLLKYDISTRFLIKSSVASVIQKNHILPSIQNQTHYKKKNFKI